MTNGANVFEGKIALAKRNIERGMKPGKMMAIIPDGTIAITKTQALARRSSHFTLRSRANGRVLLQFCNLN